MVMETCGGVLVYMAWLIPRGIFLSSLGAPLAKLVFSFCRQIHKTGRGFDEMR